MAHPPIDPTDRSFNPRQVIRYLGLLSLLVNVVNPAFLLLREIGEQQALAL